MRKFLERVIISIILLSFVGAVIFIFSQWVFCLVVSLFIAAGLFDFFKMIEKKGVFVYKYFGIIAGTMLPLTIFLGYGMPGCENLEPLLIVVASLFVFILQFIRRDNGKDQLISTALTLFSLFYIAWFFSFFIKLKLLENGNNLVFFLIIVTKIADMGAYAIGSRFGRKELIPHISPKKTVEGTLGGIAVSLLFSILLGRVLTGFSYAHLTFLGIMLAVVGQVGDLAESLIKRDCGVKDSGTYLGGIGGSLDLIDSLLFTVPVFYFYVKAF